MGGDESRSGLAASESLSSTQAVPCHPHSTLNTARHDAAQTSLHEEARKTLLASMLRTAADSHPKSLTSEAVLFSFQSEKFPQSMSPQDRLQAAQAAMLAAVEGLKSELSRLTANVTSPQGDHSAGADPSQVWREPVPTASTTLPTVTSAPTTLANPKNNPAPSLDEAWDWLLPSFPTTMDYGLPSTPESLFDETIASQLDQFPVPTGFGSKYNTKVTSEDEENANTISEADLRRMLVDHRRFGPKPKPKLTPKVVKAGGRSP